MNVFELCALLRLDSSPYEKGLSDAENSAKGGGSKIGKALGTAGKVAGVALAAVSAAVVAFGKSSVEAGMTFDTSMSKVAATMGFTVEDLNTEGSKAQQTMQQLGEFAQEMGRTTAFSATESAEALNYMALAGYKAEESMQMLPTVLDLAAAGGMQLADASDMVTDAQSALGLGIDETTAMVDQMARTASKTNTSVAQLGEAFLTIGATAKNLSGGTVELATVLGVLADNGIKGAEGGTHLRNMILSLQNPTSDAQQIMAQLGLSVYDSEGNMRSMVDIVGDLKKATNGMNQASKDAIVSGIFNKTDLAAVNALLGTTDEKFAELTESIEDSHGAAKAMAATQLDNLAGDITLFQSALEGAKIAVSEGLTPSLRGAVQFGTDGISKLTKAFKEEGLTGAINALDEIISQGVELLFSALPKVLEAGTSLVMALLTAIVNNLPQLLPAAFQIIETLATGLLDNIDGIVDSAVNILLMLVDYLVNNVDKLADAAIQIILALANGLIQAIPQLMYAAPQIIGKLIEALIKNLPQILETGALFITKFIEGIMAKIAGVAEAASNIFKTIKDSLFGNSKEAWSWGSDMMKNFIDGIQAWFGTLVDKMKNIGQTIRDFIGFSEPKLGPLSNFHTFAPDMMKLFAEGIEDNAGLVEDAFDDALSFGTATSNGMKTSTGYEADMRPITIIVQSVLDGKVIGQTAYEYNRRQQRAGVYA